MKVTPSEPGAPEVIRLDDGPAGIVQLDGLTGVRVNLSSGSGAAEDKIRVLSEAGVRVVESPGQIGVTVVEVLGKGRGHGRAH